MDRIALLKNKVFLKSLSLSILLSVGSNLTGFNAVSFYLQTIIESTRTKLRSDIASVVIGCIQIFAALCATLVSNKFGRRKILLASLSGIFLGLVSIRYEGRDECLFIYFTFFEYYYLYCFLCRLVLELSLKSVNQMVSLFPDL